MENFLIRRLPENAPSSCNFMTLHDEHSFLKHFKCHLLLTRSRNLITSRMQIGINQIIFLIESYKYLHGKLVFHSENWVNIITRGHSSVTNDGNQWKVNQNDDDVHRTKLSADTTWYQHHWRRGPKVTSNASENNLVINMQRKSINLSWIRMT